MKKSALDKVRRHFVCGVVLRYAALLIFCIGCQSIVDTTAFAARHRSEVVLITGLAGYWPRVGALQEKLARVGIKSSLMMGIQKGELIDQHASRTRRSQQGPIIVGYSIGATGAIDLANALHAHGVKVPLLVLLDATHAAPLPANVAKCLNIYKSQPLTDWIPIMRGLPVTACSRCTTVVNYDVRREERDTLGSANHLTLASFDEVHDIVVQAILATDDAAIARGESGLVKYTGKERPQESADGTEQTRRRRSQDYTWRHAILMWIIRTLMRGPWPARFEVLD